MEGKVENADWNFKTYQVPDMAINLYSFVWSEIKSNSRGSLEKVEFESLFFLRFIEILSQSFGLILLLEIQVLILCK